MTRNLLLALAVLAAAPALASAQEAVTLKFPPPAAGDVLRMEFNARQAMRTLRLDAYGNDLLGSRNSAGSLIVYNDEILDVDAGKVTRFRRTFESVAESVNDSMPLILSCHGKTVLVDERGLKREVTWENGEPAGDTLSQKIDDLLRGSRERAAGLHTFDPLPAAAVKPGDTWNVDVSAMVKECQAKHGCAIEGATGTAKLAKVYDGPRGKRATVEVHISIPLQTIRTATKKIDLSDGSGTTLDATYDFACDGKDSYYASGSRMTFIADGRAVEPDSTTSRMRLEMTMELKEHRSQPAAK
jgi:hypothetical protein